jgi:excisionase family DNA binding protein
MFCRPSIRCRDQNAAVWREPMSNLKTNLVGVQEASRILGVVPNTVIRWARQKKLPFTVTPGGRFLFDPVLLKKLIDARTDHSALAGIGADVQLATA